jgi:hypothetical protein
MEDPQCRPNANRAWRLHDTIIPSEKYFAKIVAWFDHTHLG